MKYESKITFCGGTGTVTGANFLLETGTHSLLVDCGLTQGHDFGDMTNYEAFPYEPASVAHLIVTHAHMDHIGRIPKLVRDGFKGSIHSTHATKDLARAMFDDAVNILKQEATQRNVPPLYEAEDVERALSLWQVHEYHTPFSLPDDVVCTFKDAGHILGSALVFLERAGKVFVFTGDIGNTPDVLLKDTESVRGANFMVMESVYGDRNHEGVEGRREVLEHALKDVNDRKGVLLIPSFSLQRTQVLLSEMHSIFAEKKVPEMPIFLDSPLAIKVLEAYEEYKDLYNEKTQAQFRAGESPFSFENLTLTKRAEDAHVIEQAPLPKVIIAGSGMSHGGRIRAHEKRYLGDRNAIILFVGYQTVGSLGRRIKDGAPKVKIDEEWIKVRAEIRGLDGYSAHRDRDGLLSFVEDGQETLEKVFVAMGEPKSALFLTQRIRDFLDLDATAPAQGASYTVDW